MNPEVTVPEAWLSKTGKSRDYLLDVVESILITNRRIEVAYKATIDHPEPVTYGFAIYGGRVMRLNGPATARRGDFVTFTYTATIESYVDDGWPFG